MLKFVLPALLMFVMSAQVIAQGPPPGNPGGDPELTKEQMAAQIVDVRNQAELAFDNLHQIKSLASDKISNCITLKLNIQEKLNNYVGNDKADLEAEFAALKVKLTTYTNEYMALKPEYDAIVQKMDEAEDQTDLFVKLQQEKLWRPCGLLAISLYTSAETDCTTLMAKYSAVLAKISALYFDLFNLNYILN